LWLALLGNLLKYRIVLFSIIAVDGSKENLGLGKIVQPYGRGIMRGYILEFGIIGKHLSPGLSVGFFR